MKVMYLGTAAAEGIPAIFCQCDICREAERRGGKDLRFRTSALVNDRVLIDVSPDLYAQKLRFQLDLGNIRHMLITHAHMDHFDHEELSLYIEGIAHLKQRSTLTLYGSSFTAKVWHEYINDILMKEPTLPEFIDFQVLTPYKTVQIDGLNVTPLKAVHSCEESFIYLLEQDGATFLYGNDTGVFPQETWEYLQKNIHTPLTAVSLDSTMGKPESSYNGHMTLAQNIEVRNRMLQEGMADEQTQFICHHFSHNGLMLHDEMEEMMKPHHFAISYDGMVVEI